MRKAGSQGRPGRRRDARRRRGLGRDARPARHRDVPGREPGRLARASPTRSSTPAPISSWLGTARDPRHGALPRRLIAYSLGNFPGYKNFGTGGTLSLSAILSVTLEATPPSSEAPGPRFAWTPMRFRIRPLTRERAARGAALARRTSALQRRRSARTARSSCDVRSCPCHLTRRRRAGKSRSRASPCPGPGARPRTSPGWNVHPAADGRGTPARPRMPRGRFWPILVTLLIVNYWVASTLPGQARSRAHRVLAAVPARGAGQQRQPGHDHRPEDRGRVQEARLGGKQTSRRFQTSQPPPPATTSCPALPGQERPDQRQAAAAAAACSRRTCSASGRRCCSSASSSSPSARPPMGGGSARFGRSQGQALRGDRAGDVRRTSPASTRPRRSSSRSSTSSRTPRSSAASAARSRAACC